ncbi:MAG: hypothetical protein MHPSP_003797, partial [Paramarteilia canceri]
KIIIPYSDKGMFFYPLPVQDLSPIIDKGNYEFIESKNIQTVLGLDQFNFLVEITGNGSLKMYQKSGRKCNRSSLVACE